MRLKFRDRDGSCLRESKDAEAAGSTDIRRAFVSVRVRENMTEVELLTERLSHVSDNYKCHEISSYQARQHQPKFRRTLLGQTVMHYLSHPSLDVVPRALD